MKSLEVRVASGSSQKHTIHIRIRRKRIKTINFGQIQRYLQEDLRFLGENEEEQEKNEGA